ncbi:MAG: murein biosynthesis integral membrane protein MurJ [Planctomycetales bacterium]|nr:murein biosynthesis integral membrane protein MurJ [Planctomycetales bacterium]
MDEHRQFIAGLRVTTLWTVTSRLLGMVRDMATAALLGLSTGGVMDAFVIAFRIPNLFRRLFGEGALAASYLPVLAEEMERDRGRAWQLASVTFRWLAIVLAALVVVGEIGLALLWLIAPHHPRLGLLLGLAAVMLPYLWFICLAAQVSATLQALHRFGTPAFVPVLLNVVWITGALVIAPVATADKASQAYVLALCVLVGGVLQLVVQLPVLRKLGFRYDYHWPAVRQSVSRILVTLLPMLLGLAVTQINTLLDSLIAWIFSSAQPETPIRWLGSSWNYPMQQGAAAAIYYGERLYQLPVGILGIAVATVIFPLLSRHAARGDHRRIGADLSLGLRLVLFLAVPAAAGLVLLAEPTARLLFERGEFRPEDTVRTARMIRAYAVGVWAYCALPVLVRGFYALQDAHTPLRIGLGVVTCNLVLNLILIWPLAEAGLALSTAAAAALQVFWLAAAFAHQKSGLEGRAIAATLWRSVAASAAMFAAGILVQGWLTPGAALAQRIVAVVAPLLVCLAVYLTVYRLLGGSEWRLLASRKPA